MLLVFESKDGIERENNLSLLRTVYILFDGLINSELLPSTWMD